MITQRAKLRKLAFIRVSSVQVGVPAKYPLPGNTGIPAPNVGAVPHSAKPNGRRPLILPPRGESGFSGFPAGRAFRICRIPAIPARRGPFDGEPAGVKRTNGAGARGANPRGTGLRGGERVRERFELAQLHRSLVAHL